MMICSYMPSAILYAICSYMPSAILYAICHTICHLPYYMPSAAICHLPYYMPSAILFRISAFLSTQCICVFHMTCTINNDYFPKQHELVGLCNGCGLCCLQGTNCIFTCSLGECQSSKG